MNVIVGSPVSLTGWQLNFPCPNPQAEQAFSSLESVFALEGEPVTTSSLCSVVRVHLGDKTYYVKRYRRGGEALGEFVGTSKARTEWQNLLRFQLWGLPVPNVVAYGQEPWWKFPRRGVVITEAIEGSTDLAILAREDSPLFNNTQWIEKVSQQVADASRVMHSYHFAHNDWKWRNILVSGDIAQPQIYLIDCPAGRFWRGPFFEYRRIKDLACLDKEAKSILSKSQRLRFYLRYTQQQRLTRTDRKIVQKILHFFLGRD